MIRFIIVLLICSVANGQLIIDQYKFAVPPPTNYFPTGNAASPGENTNSIGTWFKEAGGTPTSVSVTDMEGGTRYAIRVTADDGASDRARINVTVPSGVTLYYSYIGRQVTGAWTSNTGGLMGSWTGITSAFYNYINFEGWKLYSGSFTTNSTTLGIRAYSADDAGNAWEFYNLYITETPYP